MIIIYLTNIKLTIIVESFDIELWVHLIHWYIMKLERDINGFILM